MTRKKYKYRELSRYGMEQALALLDEMASGLWEDHCFTMAKEFGSMKAHETEEPGCSYCRWIKKAQEYITT